MTQPASDIEQQLKDALEAIRAAREAEEAAARIPDDTTFYLDQDAPTSLTVAGLLLVAGDTATITRAEWAGMLPAQRDSILDLLHNPKRQAKILGGQYLHEGAGPRVDAEPGSHAWIAQRRRDWAAANAMTPGPEKDAELARLKAHYSSPEQTDWDRRSVVSSRTVRIIGGGHRSDLVGPPR